MSGISTEHGVAAQMAGSIDLERCRAGHRDAWKALFDLHYPFVQRTARRLGTPAEELDDVCQAVFLVVFKKLDQFTHGRFTTWLYRITANVVSDRHRRRRVRGAFLEILRAMRLAEPLPEPILPDHLLELQDRQRIVGEILARMSAKKREVFVLYELEGLAGEEIAERVGCKFETVRTRLFHARKEFARLAQRRAGIEEAE